MTRVDIDTYWLRIATDVAVRGTCARRKVGCVLVDRDGRFLASGYNGPPSGEPHCIDTPCPGATAKSGQGLELCEAVHAEMNALKNCHDDRQIWTCYVTHSPCLICVRLLKNTACRRIVFAERYAHDALAQERWLRRPDHFRKILDVTLVWEHHPI